MKMEQDTNNLQIISTRITSPLRYPGGKSRAIKKIIPLIPEFKEYREPLVGGGSVFVALKQLYPNKKFWINDINSDLYFFYKYFQESPQKFVEEIKKIKKERTEGTILYKKLTRKEYQFTEFQRAVRFFILNRITFSGLIDAGGYSEEAFKTRFTDSSIERLKKIRGVLGQVKITNEDYEGVVNKDGKEVFIFLDPPYLSKSKSKLYGSRGCFHENFDHQKFAEVMRRCKHKWLITYDDSEQIIQLFSFAYIYRWKLQYCMNNVSGNGCSEGEELFITNYKIPSLEPFRIRQKA